MKYVWHKTKSPSEIFVSVTSTSGIRHYVGTPLILRKKR
jgi:hypothetical protein